MRFLSLNFSLLLIGLCMIMQQQNVAAKPFIFKFFVPQAPARTDTTSSSSSTYSSSGIDFSSILSTKLNLLSSLLRSGLSSGVSFGFGKLLPKTQPTTTRRPYTSSTVSIPEDDFEPESTTKSSLKTTTVASTSTKATVTIENDKTSGSDMLSEPINKDSKKDSVSVTEAVTVTDDNNNNKNGTSKEVANDNSGYDYTTSGVTTVQQKDISSSTPRTGYNYELMSDNEISNDIMAIGNHYLPSY